MTPLVDSLLVALLDAECQQCRCPVTRLQKGVGRVEQLLGSTGYPETAKKLEQLRVAVEPPIPVSPQAADPRDEDPLIGRRKRRQPVLEGK